jgi:hypothetical protein
MVASNIPSFRLFGLLPAELRLQIWRMAFDNLGAAVSVCQFEGNHTWANRLNGRIFPQTFERFKNIANG